MKKWIAEIIDLHYRPGSLARDVLVRHSEMVANAAVAIASRVTHLEPDVDFIEDAAMLHDIGIFYTNAPDIGCDGGHAYVCHGYLGRMLLEKHGLHRHAMVCERHVGVGLGIGDIKRMALPVPVRDMIPETVEERIICFADSFFSKMPAPVGTAHTVESIRASLETFGRDKVRRFASWLEMFGPPPSAADMSPITDGIPLINTTPCR